jgi:AraC-like DNA-binding protein
MDLAIPIRELVNVVALAQALIFAGILMAGRFRLLLANRILIVSFIIIATVKLDQLYQLSGGMQYFPSLGFIFTPVQWLLTPSLYFFVLAKLNSDFRFRRSDLWHLLLAAVSLVYWSVTYFSLPVDGKIAFLQSGALGEPLNALFIPLASDLIQLAYLVAAQQKLAVYGLTLRNWFSQIDDADILWTRRVLAIWVVAFLGHSVYTLGLRIFEWYSFARIVLDLLNVAHLLLISALMILAVVSHFEPLSPYAVTSRKKKYAGSDQSPDQRLELYVRVQQVMRTKAHHLKMDLNLGELAGLMAVTSRDLSEAINGEGGLSFYDFVNSYRVKAAERLLVEHPQTQILDIAYQSGFNSKSTFNKVFKDRTGQTPSEFRKSKAKF